MLRSNITAAFVAIIASSVVITPYGSIAADAEPAAEAPKAAAKQFIQALKDGDRKAYASVVVPGELANSLFDFAAAAQRFQKKMVKAYGEVGWKNFQDSEGANIKLAYHDMNLEEMKFDITDDTAKGRLPDDEEALRLIRKDGQWKLDLETSFVDAANEEAMTAESFAKALGLMAKVISDYEQKIGDNTSVDQLDKEMGEAFFAVLASAGATPKVSIKVQ